MGANAQTSVPTFTAGEVLTAANMNISARTGVPVFVDTTARDAGFGGTGEKTLAEGQLCYLESTDVVQYYNGSAWATVGPASAGALVKIAGETSFTTVSAVNLTSVLSSTYTNYLLTVTVTAASATSTVGVLLRNGSTDNTANIKSITLKSEAASTSSSSSTTQWRLGEIQSGNTTSAHLYLWGPQLADQTRGTSHGINEQGATCEGHINSHLVNDTTAYDGLSIVTGTGTMTGYYTLYGLGK